MFTLNDIKKALPNADILQSSDNDCFIGGCTDSRKIKEGELFFAISSSANDGHEYLENAIKAGATGVVISRDINIDNRDICIIKVENTLLALQELSGFIRKKYNPFVIAITGSAGKTTTKDMVSYILEKKFDSKKNFASYNNHLGVPLTLLELENKTTHLVQEVGANHIGEIDILSKIVSPDVGLITNVGYAHIGEFGSLENTLSAKCELLENIKPDGTIILNGDNLLLKTKADDLKKNGRKVITIGLNENCDIIAKNLKIENDYTECLINLYGNECNLKIKMVGEQYIYAALFAIACANICNIDLKESCDILRDFESYSGRFNLKVINHKLKIIDDSYNSSPDAVLMALKTVKSFKDSRRIVILGEMKELGTFSRECHEIVGKEASVTSTDIIATGEIDAGIIINSAIESGFDKAKTHRAKSAKDALSIVKSILKSDEKDKFVVLVKGSRFTHMERVVLGLSDKNIQCNLSVCKKYIHCRDCEELEKNN